jgi:hypothetical protein
MLLNNKYYLEFRAFRLWKEMIMKRNMLINYNVKTVKQEGKSASIFNGLTKRQLRVECGYAAPLATIESGILTT